MVQVIHVQKCNTVGELLDALTEIAKNPELAPVLDSSIESDGAVFDRFKITQHLLTDNSPVLDFELME